MDHSLHLPTRCLSIRSQCWISTVMPFALYITWEYILASRPNDRHCSLLDYFRCHTLQCSLKYEPLGECSRERENVCSEININDSGNWSTEASAQSAEQHFAFERVSSQLVVFGHYLALVSVRPSICPVSQSLPLFPSLASGKSNLLETIWSWQCLSHIQNQLCMSLCLSVFSIGRGVDSLSFWSQFSSTPLMAN